MFKYNVECKAKTGEYFTPITQEGEYIVCVNRVGRTVYKKPSDFDLSSATEENTEKVIVVSAKKTSAVSTASMTATENVKKKDKFVYVSPIVSEAPIVEKTETVEEVVETPVVEARTAKTPGSKLVDFESGDVQIIKDEFKPQEIKVSTTVSKVNDEEYI